MQAERSRLERAENAKQQKIATEKLQRRMHAKKLEIELKILRKERLGLLKQLYTVSEQPVVEGDELDSEAKPTEEDSEDPDFLVTRADAVIREHGNLLKIVSELRDEVLAREEEVESLRASIRSSLAIAGQRNVSEVLRQCFTALGSQQLTEQVPHKLSRAQGEARTYAYT